MITQRRLDQAKTNARSKLRRMRQKVMYRYLGERLEIVAPMLVGETQLPPAPGVPGPNLNDEIEIERDLSRAPERNPLEQPGVTY